MVTFPLTSAQLPVWYEQKLHADSPLYTIGGYFEMQGPVDPVLFEKALRKVLSLHEVFSMSFAGEDGVPCQFEGPARENIFSYIDLTEQGSAACLDWMQERHLMRLHTERDEMYAFTLLKASADHFFWHIKLHHLLIDGWGISLMVSRLNETYSAYADNAEHEPEPGFRYSDFIRADHEYRAGSNYVSDAAYWAGKFEDTPAPQYLGSPYRTLKDRTETSYRRTFVIPKDMKDSLAAPLEAIKASTFHYFIAILYIYFRKTRMQQDFIIGLPILNRSKAAFKKTIGLFASVMPFRMDTENISLRELLLTIKNALREDFKHQQYPVSEIFRFVKTLDPSRERLFEISLSYEKHNYPDAFNGYPSAISGLPHHHEQNTLAVYVREFYDDLTIDVDFNEGVWDEYFSGQFIDHFRFMFSECATGWDRKIAEIPVVTAEEKHMLLTGYNDQSVKLDIPAPVHSLFADQARINGSATAVVSDSVAFSYAELDELSDRIAGYLEKVVGLNGSVVAVYMQPSMEYTASLLGILKSGNAFVSLDMSYPRNRIEFIIEDSSSACMLVCRDPEKEWDLGELSVVSVYTAMKYMEKPSGMVDPASAAYIIYTSGSTGEPKGSVIQHSSLSNLCRWHIHEFGVTVQDRAVKYAGLGFDASVWEIFPYLAAGASLYIPDETLKMDLPALNEFFEKNNITISFLPTQVCEQFMALENTSLRVLLTGGDRLVSYKPVPYRLYNNYGPSENTVVSTTYEVKHPETSIPIGRPISNHKAFVLDNDLSLLPVGATGELCMSGAGLSSGYLNRPELNMVKFIDNPFFPGERLYRTGDLVRWRKDGNLQFIGRKDTQVKLRGYRIETGEIESVMSSFPGLDQCFVTVISRGSNAVLCGYYTGAESTDEKALTGHLSQDLPAYMVPSFLVRVEAFPLTPNGKINKALLPLPETQETVTADIPETSTQQILLDCWKEILGLSDAGIHDNFFYLGGDSIKAIRISSKLFQLGLKVEFKDIFNHPTVAGLSTVVKKVGSVDGNDVGEGEIPLTPVQKWFFEKEFTGQHHWNQSLLFTAQRKIDIHHFEKALQEVISHHDTLRMHYVNDAGTIRQVAGSAVDKQYTLEHYSAPPDPGAFILSKTSSLQQGMNLEEGILVKAAVFSGIVDYVFIAIHHLAVDAVSWGILLQDLTQAYMSLEEGKKVVLPTKTTSFRRWSERLQGLASAPALQKEADYWNSLLQGVSYPDKPLRRFSNKEAVRALVSFSAEDTCVLKQTAHRAYNTDVKDLLLTALYMTLREQGIGKLLVNLEGHGREELFEDVNVSGTVGWFTSIFPVLLESSSLEPGQCIKEVKEQLRRIPGKGIGYGILRYLSQPALLKESYPEFGFNYLGELNALSNGLFQRSSMDTGPMWNPDAECLYLLDITAHISNEILFLELICDAAVYTNDTAERLAKSYKENMLVLLEHCVQVSDVNYTPSDFGDSSMSFDELDAIFGKIGDI